MRIRNLIVALVLACSLGLFACSGEDYAKTIKQGRAVAFGNGTVTFVNDTNVDPKKAPMFDGKVLTFKLPADKKEIGPEPKVGCLIDFNLDKNQVSVFRNNMMETVPVTLVGKPEMYESHADQLKDKKFPIIDSAKEEVTLYMKKHLFTFKIPNGMPADKSFWTLGDLVRVFSTQEGQARRFMNVTQTNIFKK